MSEQTKEMNANWREIKEAEKAEVLKMIGETAKEVIISPAKFKNYLQLQGIFDRYSVSNVLLIHKQKPAATKLKDFQGWSEENRHVLKGQKGILILQPETYQKRDGTEGISYNVKKLFDISQVSGTPDGKFPPGTAKVARALLDTSPIDLKEVDHLEFESNGIFYNDQENILYVEKAAMSDIYFLQFAVLELAYAQVLTDQKELDMVSANFMAKCAACEICSKYGADIKAFEFDDIPEEWKNMDSKGIRKQLDKVRASANRIIARVSPELYHKQQKDVPDLA